MMTSAEFKTLRESLGLSAQWVADQARVKLRTAQYWESGGMPVPNDVANLLLGVDQALTTSVAQAVAQIDQLTEKQGAPVHITLVRYRSDTDLWRFRPDMQPLPATTHAVMLARLRRELAVRNIPSAIEFMQPEAYAAWLQGRPDTEAERAAWAASLQDRPDTRT